MVASAEDRDPVEELAEKFLEQLRAGESVSVDSYASRHPSYAKQIHALFPTLMLMEGGKPQHKTIGSSTITTQSDPLLSMQVERLGDFRIERTLGRGGMGIVYEATQESLGRRVALKVLSPSLFTTTEMVGRFQREARAAATLHHTNIVPVYSVGDQWGVHYYAMQYIDGSGLDAILANEVDPLRNNFDRIAQIGKDVAEALDYAHQHSTLHRDIKPANLLLDQAETIWISDFGLAKLVDIDDGLTHEGQTIGTMRYMPPEQFSGDADHRGDIYSLGLTLYELLAWEPAFSGRQRTQLAKQIMNGDFRALREINPHVPSDLETIVLKAISRDPDHRYDTARDLADDLGRFQQLEPIHARRLYPWERLARWAQRNPAIASLSTIAASLVAIVAVTMSVAFLKTTAAYTKATQASSLATHTLDNIFDRFGPADGLADAVDAVSQPVLSTESADLLQELVGVYDHLDASKQHNELSAKAADAQRMVGRIHYQLGNYSTATSALREALNRYQKIPASASATINVAKTHHDLAEVAAMTAAPIVADKHIHAAFTVAVDNLTDKSLDPRERDELLFAQAHGAYLRFRQLRRGLSPFDFPPAQILVRNDGADANRLMASYESENLNHKWINKAQTLLISLVHHNPDVARYRHLQAVCWYEAAHDVIDMRTERDWRLEKQAIQQLRDLIQQHADSTEYRYSLIECLTQVDLNSFALYSTKTLEDLTERYKEAATLAEQLSHERPDVAAYGATTAHVAFELGMLLDHAALQSERLDRLELLAESERYYRRAANRQGLLVKKHPNRNGYLAWHAVFQVNLARVEHKQRQLDQAHVLVTRAIRTLEKIPSDTATDPDLRRIASHCYVTLSHILEDRGRRERSEIAKQFASELEKLDDFPMFRRGPRRNVRDLFAPPPHLR